MSSGHADRAAVLRRMRSYLDIKFNYELCYRIDQSGNAVGYVLTGG